MATSGAASRRPKLPCQSALAHSAAPIWGRPGEGSEGPLWSGVGLLLGRFGHRQAAGAQT
eukprot:12061628-Alexandrium_andersonii.AAC.1